MENSLIIVEIIDGDIIKESIVFDKRSDNLFSSEKLEKFFDKNKGVFEIEVRHFKEV